MKLKIKVIKIIDDVLLYEQEVNKIMDRYNVRFTHTRILKLDDKLMYISVIFYELMGINSQHSS